MWHLTHPSIFSCVRNCCIALYWILTPTCILYILVQRCLLCTLTTNIKTKITPRNISHVVFLMSGSTRWQQTLMIARVTQLVRCIINEREGKVGGGGRKGEINSNLKWQTGNRCGCQRAWVSPSQSKKGKNAAKDRKGNERWMRKKRCF